MAFIKGKIISVRQRNHEDNVEERSPGLMQWQALVYTNYDDHRRSIR